MKIDIFERIENNPGVLGQWSKQGHGYFMFPKLEGKVGHKMKFRGKDVLNWSINNYFGLASNEEIKKQDIQLVEKYGLSTPMGSRLMTGETALHEKLEDILADFFDKEDAFVLNSFYQGMVSILDCLCGKDDVILYNADIHASIHDGIKMHKTKRFIFQQNNIENIENQIKRACEYAEESRGGVLFVTEGVIGITGRLAPLDEIVKLKEKYNFRILVEDAHGFCTIGANGKGAAEQLGVNDKIDLIVSTFGKAIGLSGGFVAGNETIINYLRYNMRSQTFSEALPSSIVASVINRLNFLRERPELREKLWENVNYLQKSLRNAGLNIGNTESTITPVYVNVHNMPEAIHLMVDLRETYNIFCMHIIYPYIQHNSIMIRLIPTILHTKEDIDYTVDALVKISEKLKAGKYMDDKPIMNDLQNKADNE